MVVFWWLLHRIGGMMSQINSHASMRRASMIFDHYGSWTEMEKVSRYDPVDGVWIVPVPKNLQEKIDRDPKCHSDDFYLCRDEECDCEGNTRYIHRIFIKPKSKWRDFLCRIGFHKWRLLDTVGITNPHKCERCKNFSMH